MASGKSTLARALVREARGRGLEVVSLDVDTLRRQRLTEDQALVSAIAATSGRVSSTLGEASIGAAWPATSSPIPNASPSSSKRSLTLAWTRPRLRVAEASPLALILVEAALLVEKALHEELPLHLGRRHDL